jgi:DNA-binding SARP family transcriptional activator
MLTEIRDTQTWNPRETEHHERDDNKTLVCLLGSFRLLHDDRPLDLLVAGKAMALLAALALRLDSGVPREALLEMLWPEQDAAQSTVSLNSLVYSLHRRLREDALGASAVIYANGSYYLNREAGYGTDIARFDVLAARGNWLATTENAPEATRYYERALRLYRGDLCTGTDVYAVIERERLRASFLTILAWLAERAFLDGDYAAALEHALRLIACDPCREDAHRLVMRARVRRGERAQALRQYRLCEHVLRREFDVEPEEMTTALFDQIRVDPSSI